MWKISKMSINWSRETTVEAATSRILLLVQIHNKNNTINTKITQFQLTYKICKKVQIGKDREKVQSEKDSHSKNRGGKKPN